jgi:peptidoglycan/xylan/chitin deacetylase (PgdA/CDA1 family)
MNKGSVAYAFSDLKSTWEKAAKYEVREAKTASLQYRVYVEPSPNGRYVNTVMVRHLEGYETTSLFVLPADKYEAFPSVEEIVDQTNFAHGSRIRRREIALVFDLMDSAEGLTETLIFLEDYGLKATFFLNGEFIRRYPDAAAEIQKAGHEVASMFYVNFNMTDSRYQIDEDFIKRGLARNEDEYYKATGNELSLFWHAPYYSVTSEIIAYSAKMNYRYIGRDVEPFDWVGVEESKRLLGSYFSAHDIVERIMKEKKPGSIIPIRLGKSENGRSDYLFQHLDVLFNALKSEGYEIIPVSTMVDRNR